MTARSSEDSSRRESMQAKTEDANSGPNTRRPSSGLIRDRRIRAGAAIALALVIGFVVWLVLRGGNSSPSTSPIPAGSKPVRISTKGLHTLSALGIRIYWIGDRPGYTYELTKPPDNRVFVRYLPAGTDVGTKKPYLTIGTYPTKNAFATVRRRAGSSGSVRIRPGGGAVGYYRSDTPNNVFLAYPSRDYTIEVFDPSPGRARDLVSGGQVVAAR